MRPKRTRRPGDKGGAAGNGGQQPNGGQRPGSAEGSGDAPKPRRRHRGRRGRGNGGPDAEQLGTKRRSPDERTFSPGGFCLGDRACGLEPAPCHNF